MYEAYWRLKEKPFEQTADPRFFFAGESHQAALLKLRYALENRRGGALLTGPTGAGKTQIVETLASLIDPQIQPFVHIVFPQMSADELLAYLADELTGEFLPTNGIHASVQRIESFLSKNVRAGRHAVVVIDEAQLLTAADTLEVVRLAMNFQIDHRQAMSLILVGQTALLPLLRRMPQLDERLAIKCVLRPFSREETAKYVRHRIETAGGSAEIVAPEAFDVLHSLTHGLPRQINRLCDLALLIGYADQCVRIGPEQFEAAAEELTAVAPE